MTKERRFYIAYRICNFIYGLESSSSFELHELCMYIADLAEDINMATTENSVQPIQYCYNRLQEEILYLADTDWVNEVKGLITLLDEWRTCV